MQFKSYAKINLALDVLGKDETGFHQIRTIFYEYKNLYDEIRIEQTAGKDIIVDCNWPIPVPQNSCYLVAKLLKEKAKIDSGIRINIKKNIPMGSGLGGAASNAAIVLKTLNQLWQLNCDQEELAQIGAEIGKDVPFFIYGGVALGSNYGEKITPLSTKLGLKIKILWPPVATLTGDAYRALDLTKCGLQTSKTDQLLIALKNNDQKLLLKNIHNDFETLLDSKISPLYEELYAKRAKKVCLSGSGSAVFAIF